MHLFSSSKSPAKSRSCSFRMTLLPKLNEVSTPERLVVGSMDPVVDRTPVVSTDIVVRPNPTRAAVKTTRSTSTTPWSAFKK